MKILLVEDDQPTGSALAEILSAHDYTVTLATDGQDGLQLAQTHSYDLILLDIGIPTLDGISLCKQLRAEGDQTPILLLTARDSSRDCIAGLDAGADDYVIKPYDPAQLLARIRALLRRGKTEPATTITWENLRLDVVNNQTFCNEQTVHLTPKEYCLLELFLLNPQRIFSRRAILDRLWDFAEAPGEETISTHIKCIRQKLKAAGGSDPIETVHGLGYRLRPPTQPQANPERTDPEIQTATLINKEITTQEVSEKKTKQQINQQTNQQKATNVVSKVWQKFQHEYVEKVDKLLQIATALETGQFTPALHQQMQHTAHQLAGGLGIFGLTAGSQLAKELEHLLQTTPQPQPKTVQQILALVNLLQNEVKQPQTAPPETVQPIYTPLILIIDDDLLLAERIRIEAITWDLRVEIATDLAVARQMIAQTPPDAILLDLNFPNAVAGGLTLLQELIQRQPRIPVLVFTGRGDLAARVAVARLGGCAFLHKPLPAHQILKAVTDILNQTVTPSNRIMIVDDDAAVLDQLALWLTPLQVELTLLDNPMQFWHVLTATNPDVLVLDFEMAGFNGIDLCQVVRSDQQWRHLPIVFLSAHEDENAVTQAFTAGADDYLYKSTPEAELIHRILRRMPASR